MSTVENCELIHKGQDRFIINTNTGKSHKIDGELYRVIRSLQSGTMRFDEIVPGSKLHGALSELNDKLHFGPRRDYIEEARRYVGRIHLIKSSVAEGCLIVSQACNLACRYCYAGSSGTFGGAPRLMSKEIAEMSFRYFVENHGVFECQTLRFHGGEPLVNFPVIVDVYELWYRIKVDHPGQQMKFSITTNGTLLTPEIVRFIKENRFLVTVSLDGPRETHDANRVYKNGKGSFDDVMAGVELLKQEGVQHAVRATITADTDYEAMAVFFNENEFAEVILDKVDWGVVRKQSNYQLAADEFQSMIDQYRAWHYKGIRDMKENRTDTFHTRQLGLSFDRLWVRRHDWPFRCGAGWSLLAFDSRGKIFPCHRTVGIEQFCIGDVAAGGRDKRKVQDLYLDFLGACENCRSCWAVTSCKGLCMLEKHHSDGSFREAPQAICNVVRDSVLNRTKIVEDLSTLSRKAEDKRKIDKVLGRYDGQSRFEYYAH